MPTVLMTGGHAGIGLVAARTLAERFGYDLILAGRNRERVERAAEQLRAETGVRVDVVGLDLSSLASVRAGAAACVTLLRSSPSGDQALQGILCNAGVQVQGPVTTSVDGYEETFAANCLGHFLLVALLLDVVARDGRIVWTSSGTHDPARMDGRSVGAAAEPDALVLVEQGKDGRPMSGGRRYATSKLCIILLAYELDRRLRRAGSRIASIAYDPGFLPDTGMGRMAPAFLRGAAARFVLERLGMTMGRMPFSGEAIAVLAADPAFAAASGRYFHAKGGALSEAKSSAASYDETKAAKLWEDCARLASCAEIPLPY